MTDDVKTQRARFAVKKIVRDLTGRKGLRQEWEQIDEEIRTEIEEEWTRLIIESMPEPKE